MLQPLQIIKTSLSPNVYLDKEEELFLIYGKSISINAYEFYLPVREWFEEYYKAPNKKTELVIYLEYLNSSSLLQIKNIFNVFSDYEEKSDIKIVWLYEDDDETLKETGEEFRHFTSLNFELKNIGKGINIYDFLKKNKN